MFWFVLGMMPCLCFASVDPQNDQTNDHQRDQQNGAQKGAAAYASPFPFAPQDAHQKACAQFADSPSVSEACLSPLQGVKAAGKSSHAKGVDRRGFQNVPAVSRGGTVLASPPWRMHAIAPSAVPHAPFFLAAPSGTGVRSASLQPVYSAAAPPYPLSVQPSMTQPVMSPQAVTPQVPIMPTTPGLTVWRPRSTFSGSVPFVNGLPTLSARAQSVTVAAAQPAARSSTWHMNHNNWRILAKVPAGEIRKRHVTRVPGDATGSDFFSCPMDLHSAFLIRRSVTKTQAALADKVVEAVCDAVGGMTRFAVDWAQFSTEQEARNAVPRGWVVREVLDARAPPANAGAKQGPDKDLKGPYGITWQVCLKTDRTAYLIQVKNGRRQMGGDSVLADGKGNSGDAFFSIDWASESYGNTLCEQKGGDLVNAPLMAASRYSKDNHKILGELDGRLSDEEDVGPRSGG